MHSKYKGIELQPLNSIHILCYALAENSSHRFNAKTCKHWLSNHPILLTVMIILGITFSVFDFGCNS